MPVVNDITNRVLVKGIRIYAAGPGDTAFRRLYGLKSIGGVSVERTGEVDATELWQGPDGLAQANEEQFFVTQQFAGTKKSSPIELTINKVGKVISGPAATAQINSLTLHDWFINDKIVQWSIQLRNGYEFAVNAQVNKIPAQGEENQLINGTLELLPVSWMIYRPVPTGYQPFGNADPKWGPPGVSNVTLSWSASPPDTPRNNVASSTVGG